MQVNHIKVGHKLWGIASLVVAGTIVLIMISLISLRSSLIEDRKTQTQFLVETANGILSHFQNMVHSGKMSEQEAKSQALAGIAALRYGKNGYFWVNDMQHNIVLHPIKPKLNGKNLAHLKDPNGKKIFVAFVDQVKQSGAGFVDYYWSKPGAEQAVPKLSYVKGFKPWNYVIGTGIYIDDVDEIFYQKVWQFGLISLAIIFIVSLLSLWIIRDIRNPINLLQQTMLNVRHKHDLTQRVNLGRKDELGEMGDSFNHLLEKFHEMISHVKSSAACLNETGSEMGKISQRTNDGIIRQQQQTQILAADMEQMVAATEEMAQSTQSASEAAQIADESAQQGKTLVTSITHNIRQLSQSVTESSQAMSRLEGDVDGICGILEAIRDIADQTNLLALNAAIESARAGELGRGFAVVAGEVRVLSQRTQEATAEIQTMIESLQQHTQVAVAGMNKGNQLTAASVDHVHEAEQALESIHNHIVKINDMSTQIATAAQQQTTVTAEMYTSINDINNVASDTANESEQIKRVNHNLESLTRQSHQLVEQFVV